MHELSLPSFHKSCENGHYGVATENLLTLSNQNPALMEAPLSLELETTSPPRCTIKSSGASVSVNAIVNVLVLPPGQDPVQLSSMTMVRCTTVSSACSHHGRGCQNDCSTDLFIMLQLSMSAPWL